LGSVPNPPLFSIRVIDRGQNGYIMVGLAYRSKFLPNGQNYNKSSYSFYISNGTLFSHTGMSSYPFHTKVENGSIINVLFDREAKTISFSFDKGPLKVAFSNVDTHEDLFPIVEFHDTGSLELVRGS